jgi:hypothetical protein
MVQSWCVGRRQRGAQLRVVLGTEEECDDKYGLQSEEENHVSSLRRRGVRHGVDLKKKLVSTYAKP